METQEKSGLEESIKKTVQEMLEKMGFPAEIEIEKTSLEEGRETIVCNIKTEESNFLIGQYGVNLQSLQHIARLLARKKIDERVNFIVDVNFYRQEKNSSIERMAREMAEEAIQERRAIVMRPMSPYERRIVHMELCKNAQVKTESIGEGEDRKVVIKPVDLI
jgi:spoIIIJ-associated protein